MDFASRSPSQILSPLIDALDEDALLKALASLKSWISYLQGRGQQDPASIAPYILARLCEASGISLPGQQVSPGTPLLPSSAGKVVHVSLECLLDLEKVCDTSPTPSLLTTPGSLRALRLLLLHLHARGEPLYNAAYHSSVHTTNTPLSVLLVLLERLATSRAHGAPRSILRAGCLPAILAAGLGRGAGGERDGGRRALEATILLFNTLVEVPMEGREDAACILEGLLRTPSDLLPAGQAPFLSRVAACYAFEPPPHTAAAAAGSECEESGGGGGGLLLPQTFRWVEGCERHPAILRDCVAGPGLSTFVSHLCALAQGHWRQWGDMYATGGKEGSSKATTTTPSNWPFQALTALISPSSSSTAAVSGGGGGDGNGGKNTSRSSAFPGLLHLYAAALAAHVIGLQQPHHLAREYVLDSGPLRALLLALARTFKVLHCDAILSASRWKKGGGALSSTHPMLLPPTLQSTLIPALLSDTDLGGVLTALLNFETARLGRAEGNDSVVSSLLAALSALDACVQGVSVPTLN
jgi:hypothetical protein